MISKKLIRCLLLGVESRKDILKIAYGDEEAKRKKIEHWIDTEMLAMLYKRKERNEVERAEGEHDYDVLKTGPKGGNRRPRCDLWWVQDNLEYWLEVKTIIFHRESRRLNKHYSDKIVKDFDKEKYLVPKCRPYRLYHLLIIFNDRNYNNRNSIEDLYSLFNSYKWNLEDKWMLELDERRFLNFLSYFKSIKPD